MNKFETSRARLKKEFWVALILLPIALPLLAPYAEIRVDGRISLSGLQVLYALVSVEIALNVYIWGMGNWSRFEPPQGATGNSALQVSNCPCWTGRRWRARRDSNPRPLAPEANALSI